MTQTDTINLFPCPFCNGEAFHSKAVNGSNNETTACLKCRGGFLTTYGEHGYFDTIERWNTRPDHPAIAEVEKLRLPSGILFNRIHNSALDAVLDIFRKGKMR